MDAADEELRETIRMIWPLQARKMMDLLVPKNEMLNKYNLTVGKIYGGLLILESWRSTRFGKRKSRFGVRDSFSIYSLRTTRLHPLIQWKCLKNRIQLNNCILAFHFASTKH